MELTLISQKEYDRIADTPMTADEAFVYLSKNVTPHTFGEILENFFEGENLKKTLTDALCEYNPSISRDSVSRKIRGWLSNRYEPSDRETYLQMCFALGLSEERAQEFLCHCSDCGFHYRNPRELTYAFALRLKMKYQDAVSLYESLPPLNAQNEVQNVYTEALYNEFYRVRTVQEFIEFYKNNLDKLGALHNTAYKYFMTFMKCLRDPDADRQDLFGNGVGKSAKLSIESVMNDYIRMNVPSDTASRRNTYIQRIIKKYWPSATNIKNMSNRSEDVTRKTLILLYLITEGIASDVNYDFVFDDDLTPQERFGEHYDRICIMLTDCAMAQPDPRNVFDWAALYALKMNNSDQISSEMQELINRIFDLTESNLT